MIAGRAQLFQKVLGAIYNDGLRLAPDNNFALWETPVGGLLVCQGCVLRFGPPIYRNLTPYLSDKEIRP